ncbi:amidohydrolase [Asaia krungthepensis NRIC 0535]|uniref:Amidohydrolase n=2 Tax=Asaia krungthepensis TaxID=220990 RepID=A0ABQ0Q6X4_9PROT|nr:amidohydrolase [Asaia krungthepensis NRIC 0535]
MVLPLLCSVTLAPLAHAEPVALTHLRLIDGTGAPARVDETILIDHGQIVSIGTTPPPGATVIDLHGKTVMPALVSDHNHVGLVEGMSTASRNYTRDIILAALNQYVRYGVLTVTSLGLNKSPLFDQLRREQHQGVNPGADLFGVDQGIGAPGGMPPEAMVDGMGRDQIFRPATSQAARQAVDIMADEGTDFVKLWLDDLRLTNPAKPPLPLLGAPVWQAAIAEAHKRHLRVAVHIHDLALAHEALQHGADILAHGVRDKPVDPALVAQLKTRQAWYIPTLSLDESTYLFAEHPELLDQPLARDAMPQALRQKIGQESWRRETLEKPASRAAHEALAMNERNLLTLYRAGVRIGFGTDSGATPLRLPGYAEHRELVLLVEAGLTPLEAINLATQKAAGLLGLKDRGVIAPGKRADLLVIDGVPDRTISDIDLISQVWQRGKPVSDGLVTKGKTP